MTATAVTSATLRDFFEEGALLSLSDAEARRWAGFFIRNKMPLLGLCRQVDSPVWVEALRHECAEYEAQHTEYLTAIRAWAAAGIRCIAIKSGGFAPSFPYTSDNLDLLVQPQQRDEAVRILQRLGYVWLQNIDEPHKLLLRKFHAGRSVSAFHVHTWVGWEVEFMEDQLRERSRPSDDDPDLLVPSPEDILLINAAHAFFENKRFSLFDLERIRRQWRRPDLAWTYIEGVARRRGWLRGLCFALAVCAWLEEALFGRCSAPVRQRQHWLAVLRGSPAIWKYYGSLTQREPVLPFRVSFLFSKLLYYEKVLRDSHDGVRRRLRNVGETLVWGFRLKANLNPQSGMLIALSGIDGAGKSSHAELISRVLTTSALTHRVVWSRRGCGPLFRGLSILLRRSRASTAKTSPDLRAASAPRAFIWSILSAIDLLVVYFWRIRVPLWRGSIVVADRYVADAAVEVRQRLGPRSHFGEAAISLLRFLSPKPRLSYVLDAEPAQAAVRGVDWEDAAGLAEARSLLLYEARQHRMTVIPASDDFAASSDALVLDLLRTYFQDYATFWNAVLLSNPAQLNDVRALLETVKETP